MKGKQFLCAFENSPKLRPFLHNPKSLLMKKLKSADVLERSHLSFEDLNALIQGDILALRIFPFISQEVAQANAEQILVHEHRIQHYSMAEDVGVKRMGMTIFEAENKPEKLRQYHKLAKNSGEWLRSISGNFVNPLDLLRVRLMESWRWGLRIEHALGEPMNPGIVRCFVKGDSDGLPPHQDLLSRDLPGSNIAQQMEAQLAANIFIKVPEEGGEVQIWDCEPDLVQFESMRSDVYDFIEPENLPERMVRLKPRPGELMLFRTSCVHAVLPSKSSMRIAYSCSIGYFGMGESLSIWS